MKIRDEDILRFWSQSEICPYTGCWLWTRGCDSEGYGVFYIKHKSKWKHYRANRFSWSLINGKIPKGMLTCHHCDNSSCINPDHLFVGTHKDNTMDMIRKKRNWYYTGENHPGCKLSNKDIEQIRKTYRKGKITQHVLAAQYGVHSSTICYIVNHKYGKR